MGEDEAWEVTRDLVDEADRDGRLRGIIDAVRSNRVEDDFTDQWSYAKEDFERKLYHKRTKVKVTFVELSDTIPVHGPRSEVFEELLWEDFLALLYHKERRVVVLLRNGVTRVGETRSACRTSDRVAVAPAQPARQPGHTKRGREAEALLCNK